MTTKDLAPLLERLKGSPRITCITGAGISAPSGVPTFRGEDGLWKSYRAEELATPSAFERDPKLVWEWYDWRRQEIAKCKPNEAHHVLAKWSRDFGDFTLITQNVDGLHERAGTENIIRFHGSIWMLKCVNQCAEAPTEWWDDTVPLTELPPTCGCCGGLARPAVVWFGEMLDPRVLEDSYASTRCDVFFSIGTSSVVRPAASLLQEAKRFNALCVEINLEKTPSTGMIDLFLEGSADRVLVELDHALSQLS